MEKNSTGQIVAVIVADVAIGALGYLIVTSNMADLVKGFLLLCCLVTIGALTSPPKADKAKS